MTPRSRVDSDPAAEATMEALRRRYQPQPRERHFGWLGLLIAVFLGYLFAHLSDRNRNVPDPVERSAPSGQTRVSVSLPAREPSSPRAQWMMGSRQVLTLPNGTTLPTVFKGYLSEVSDLPLHGSQLGDMWGVGPNLWVLSTIPNSSRVGWVDPPADEQLATHALTPDGVVRRATMVGGDQLEVRRALSVQPLQVRRAKMVVPRAQLVKPPNY